MPDDESDITARPPLKPARTTLSSHDNVYIYPEYLFITLIVIMAFVKQDCVKLPHPISACRVVRILHRTRCSASGRWSSASPSITPLRQLRAGVDELLASMDREVE